MKPPRAERRRRLAGVFGWGASAALVAFVPKCALCVFAYVGVAAGLLPEICGASSPDRMPSRFSLLAAFAVFGTGLILAAVRNRKMEAGRPRPALLHFKAAQRPPG